MSPRFIRWLGDGGTIEEIGGKAHSLGELVRAGFRVPNGFCLVTDAHRESADGRVTDDVRRELLEAFAELQGGGAVPTAVRSSATAEDLDDASFAGIYETVLGVNGPDEVVAAVERCWASAHSTRADQYLADRAPTAHVEMAVIVQLLVPAGAAGVLFTAHPVTAELDTAVVSSAWGLGEAVVAALVEPDTWVVRKSPFRVLDERLGHKTAYRAASGQAAVPRERQGAASLSTAELAQLAALALDVERHFHFPQDVEWAVVDGVVHLLQSRPITTLQEAYYDAALHQWARVRGLDPDAGAVWQRGSDLSSLRVSPLYFSEMAAYFADFYADLERRDGRPPPTKQRWLYKRGWVYSNTGYTLQGRRVPKRLLDREWLPRLWLQLRHPRTQSYWGCAAYYYRRRDDDWLPGIDRHRPDLATASGEEIEAFVEVIEATRRGARSTLAPTGIDHAASLLSLLRMLLRSWAGQTDRGMIAGLTTGLDGLETHDENVAVWAVAQRARRQPELLAAMQQGDYGRLPVLPGGPALLDDVAALQAARPYRGASDRDLAQPRWDDDMTLVLDQVRLFVRGDEQDDPAAAHRRAVARREAAVARAEAAIRERAPRSAALRLRIFRELLRLTQTYWVFHDNQRHEFDRYFLNLRRAYLAAGSRLAAVGVLDEAADVFFLSKEEVFDALSGALPVSEARTRAVWRRDTWRAQADDDAPDQINGDEREPAVAAPGATLDGVAGSAGRVTAPARIITAVTRLVDVQPGEILVTTAIDPSWTRVFPIIGGLVTEEGGMLSHATVLAREYGVPAVIGVSGATRRIATGQLSRRGRHGRDGGVGGCARGGSRPVSATETPTGTPTDELETYRSRARAWLSANAEPRPDGATAWGEGSDDVSIFHNLTHDEEWDLVQRNAVVAAHEAGRRLRRHLVADRTGWRRPASGVRTSLLRGGAGLRIAGVVGGGRRHDEARRPDHPRAGFRRAARAVHAHVPRRRAAVLPVVLRTQRRLGPRRAADEGRARRRPVADHGPEGVDIGRPVR